MSAARIFISHSHKDSTFCRALVSTLRNANADVWYDEHNISYGPLTPAIQGELGARSIFILVLSPEALESQWVENETRWFYELFLNGKTRIILPVLVKPIDEEMIWPFLKDFRRIEAPGVQPYSHE